MSLVSSTVAAFLLCTISISLALEQKLKRVHIRKDSKMVLGGLFPVHSKGVLDDDRCGPILLEKGVQRLEAMLYALDRINADSNPIKFGATILDTCASDSYALEQSLQFLHYSAGLNASISRKVTAVIGASNSDVSESVANIFRLFRIPQVSYASTSEELDDLYKYPYFFRVVPSDRFQVRVILDILMEFRWTFVSVVAAKGEYGEAAAQKLQLLIRNTTHEEICLATVEILPRDAAEENYNTVVRRLENHDKARVVIVFLNEDKISQLLDACDRLDIPAHRFLWLGSDGWGAKGHVVADREKRAQGAITILPKRYPIQGFDEYFKSLKPATNIRNPWFKEFWEAQFKCQFKAGRSSKRKLCTGNEDWGEDYRQEGLVPMVIDSVNLMASAIRKLCANDSSFCSDPENMEHKYRNLLLDIIQKTSMNSVQGHGMVIKFDKTRSVPVNYTIFQFRETLGDSFEKKFAYKPIGEWNPFERLLLRDNPVWSNFLEEADDSGRPFSSCNEECGPGEERIRNSRDTNKRCCWSCQACHENEYLPQPHEPCMKCDRGKTPSSDKTSCVLIQAEYVGQDFGSPWSLIPLIFSVLGLISTFVVFVIFFMHRQTPIIMASGRELCYVILLGIVFCYCFPFIVLLRPTEISCGSLRIGIGLGLSICYSAIFTKTNRISRIFEVSMKITKRPSYISPGSQVIICVCLVLIQVTLTVLWLIVKPPDILQKQVTTVPKKWVEICVLDSISVVLGLLYNMVLLILCTIYAYKTRNIPENFNETKWISFTMYSSCIVWLAFIPIYCSALEDYKVHSTILSMSVSVSGTVTLVCIFLPKIYIVLFHPERNVRYPSSSATTGTGTCDSQQPVRYLRSIPNNIGGQQNSPINKPDAPFLFLQKPVNNNPHNSF